MTDMKHVYLTAHGSYPTGSWTGEAAQIGMRCAFATTALAPLKGDIFTPIDNGAIQPDFGTLAGTNGALSRTWTARVGASGSVDNMDADAQVGMAEDFYKFLNSLKAYLYSGFRWTHVKLAAVDAAGKSPVVSSIYTFTAPIVGASTSGLPPQVAVALSTRANLVGRRGRGRVYIPAIGATSLETDGTFKAGTRTAMQAAFKTLIDDLQALPGLTTHMPIVFVGSADSATVVRPVEVRTGQRLDTIQSRRRQVAESYVSTAL